MLNIAVCDDDAAFRAALVGRLRQIVPEQCQIFCYPSAQALSAAVRDGQVPSIAFVDIVLGTDNGIDFVKTLFSALPTQIIYMTSFVEFCQDVYETNHVWFLRKPFSDELLGKAFRRALQSLADADTKMYFRAGGSTICFSRAEVLYFESRYRKVTICTNGGKSEIYSTISEISGIAGSQFVQCHKSFLVNLSRVASMDRGCFILDNGTAVPISRSMSAATREQFFAFLAAQMKR